MALVAAAVLGVVDRLATSEQAAERRALLARNAALTAQALAPGSALACLDVEAGADLVKSCELSLFATASSVAAATSFVSERLKLIEAAQSLDRGGRTDALAGLAAERRALARDRFGLVAHVLAKDYGCSTESCAALALLGDTGTVKADLASRPFDVLVARYGRVWDKVSDPGVPVASAPTVAPEASAETPQPVVSTPLAAREALAKVEPPRASRPLDPKWKLPSAASIPPVSIMMPEPKLPAAEQTKEAEQKPDVAPLPPKRPQAQAAPPPATR